MTSGTGTAEPAGPPPAVVARLRAAGCVFAEEEAGLLVAEAGSAEGLETLLRRRVAGEPLEQVLGRVDFAGLRLVLEPGVFVPRRRTESLAAHGLRLARAAAARTGRAPVVVELCCGVAPVAAVVAAGLAAVELHAADVDPAAVRCARRNLGDRAAVHQGDLYAALPGALRGRVDVLVANAPYVPAGAVALMPPEAREHEPAVALAGGADGLDVLRAVIGGAAGWLGPRGALAVEAAAAQAAAVAGLCRSHGLAATTARSDDLDATVVIGEPIGA